MLGCMGSPMGCTELETQIQTQKPLQPQRPTTTGTITICMEKIMGMGMRITTHPSLISLEWEPLDQRERERDGGFWGFGSEPSKRYIMFI